MIFFLQKETHIKNMPVMWNKKNEVCESWFYHSDFLNMELKEEVLNKAGGRNHQDLTIMQDRKDEEILVLHRCQGTFKDLLTLFGKLQEVQPLLSGSQ